MSTPSFKLYQHGVAPYAKRRKTDEWEKHKYLLTSLHEQRVSRRLMLEALNSEGFYPSMCQLVSKLTQWNYRVLGQRRTIRHTVQQNIQVDGAQVSHHTNLPQLDSVEHSEAADLSLATNASIGSANQHEQPVPSVHYDNSSPIVDCNQELFGSETDGLFETMNSHDLGKVGDLSEINTDSHDVPELTDFESDIVSASPTTASTADEYRRQSDTSHNDVVMVADHNLSPTDVHFEHDPLFPFHSDFCAAEILHKNSARAQEAERSTLNRISRTHYCCLAFFSNGAVGKSPPTLYWHLLGECQSTRSLKYALILIFIWGTSSPYSLQNNTRYRDLIRSAAEQYLPLTTRTGIRNEYLNHISTRLACIYTSLFEETFFLNQNGLPTVLPVSKGLTILSLEHRRQDILSYNRCSKGETPYESHQEASDETMILRIAAGARGVLLSKLDQVFELIRQMDTPSFSKAHHEAGEGLHNENAWTLASKLSSLLLSVPSFKQKLIALIGCNTFAADIVTEAVGLIVADDFCHRMCGADKSLFDPETAIMSALRQLPDDLLPAQSRGQSCLTALKMRIGLVEASRLCDATRLIPDHEDLWVGSLRSCREDVLCRLLDCDITIFDNRLDSFDSFPPKTGAQEMRPETMSIRTTSSTNSSSKAKAILSRLDLRGSTTSILSVLSKWSGHLSVKSWGLENTMQVDEIPLESIFTDRDRAALDRTAFEQMRGIEVS